MLINRLMDISEQELRLLKGSEFDAEKFTLLQSEKMVIIEQIKASPNLIDAAQFDAWRKADMRNFLVVAELRDFSNMILEKLSVSPVRIASV